MVETLTRIANEGEDVTNETLRMSREIEVFMRDAFCAKSARMVDTADNKNFSAEAVYEIECDDGRGVIYVAFCERN
jgi:hypothetical protein